MYKTIRWTEEMATGVAAMDESHQLLLATVNAAAAAPDIALEAGLVMLAEVLAADFLEEERLMEQLNYPAHAEHYAAHRRVLAALEDALVYARHADVDRAREVVAMLPRWFVGHLVGMDLPLAVALEQAGHPRSQPPSVGLRKQLAQLLQDQL